MSTKRKKSLAKTTRVSLELYCHECGYIVKALIHSDTRKVMCPQCKGFKVYSCPDRARVNQTRHYDKLMAAIGKNIKRQNRKYHKGTNVGASGYTYKQDWLNELYNE